MDTKDQMRPSLHMLGHMFVSAPKRHKKLIQAVNKSCTFR